MKKIALLVGLAAAFGFNNAEAVDWNWKGDVRERYESQLTNTTTVTDTPGSSRARTRVRLGVYPWINEELSAGVQISTGNDTPAETISRNQNFGSLFQPKSIYLNEEFVDYHPMSYGLNGKVNLIVGKREVASTLVRIDNLVYDSDLTFEGATLQYGKDSDGKDKDGLIAVAGYYTLNSWSSTTVTDPALMIGQLAYKGELNEMSYTVGGAYNMYRSVQNISITGDKAAIGTDTNGAYYSAPTPAAYPNSRYNIAELFGKIGGQLTDTLPWKVYGQYAHNTASNAKAIAYNRKNAWLAGVSLGEAKQVGEWALDAKYDHIERDAVFPLFTDSDRKVGTIVNVKGFEVAGTYHLVQNLTVGARYFHYSNIDKVAGDPTLHQVQLDALVKF